MAGGQRKYFSFVFSRLPGARYFQFVLLVCVAKEIYHMPKKENQFDLEYKHEYKMELELFLLQNGDENDQGIASSKRHLPDIKLVVWLKYK